MFILWIVITAALGLWYENASIMNDTLDMIVRWFIFFWLMAPIGAAIWFFIAMFN